MGNIFTNISKETKVETAVQLVIFDAIEKGLTTVSEAVNYMKSEAFETSVKRYLNLMDNGNL